MSIFIKRIKFPFTVSICFSWHLFLRLGRFVCITVTNKWPCFKSAHWVVCGWFSWGFLSQLIPYRWWLIGKGGTSKKPRLPSTADFNILNEPLIQGDSATKSSCAQAGEGRSSMCRIKARWLLFWGVGEGVLRGGKEQKQGPFSSSQKFRVQSDAVFKWDIGNEAYWKRSVLDVCKAVCITLLCKVLIVCVHCACM